METTISKNGKLTPYHIQSGGTVIAAAHCWLADNSAAGYVIEVIPYEGELEKAGIRLKEKELWDDFYDSEENAEILPETEQINILLSTIFDDFVRMKDMVSVCVRKEVFDVSLANEGDEHSLVMICQYEPLPGSVRFEPAIYVHDPEDFETWKFAANTDEKDLFAEIVQIFGMSNT